MQKGMEALPQDWNTLEPNREGRSVFLAIVGRPNVGKSSLLNRMIGQKIAIVSRKPQTTRTRIMGVLTKGADQLVFLDTPGLVKPKNSLGDYMVKSVTRTIDGVDACLLVAQAGKAPADMELLLVEKFKALGIPAVLALNKIDLVKNKEDLMQNIADYSKLFDFSAVVPVSALHANGMQALENELKKFCGS